MGGGASSPAKSSSGGAKAGQPHAQIAGAEAFYDAAFSQDLVARAGTHRAEFRAGLVGLAPVASAALGRPGTISALTLRDSGRPAGVDKFYVSAPSDCLRPVCCAETADFFAVCDGHGPDGAACASFVRDRAEATLKKAFSKGKENGIQNKDAMRDAFVFLNADLLDAKLSAASGCSACTVMLSRSVDKPMLYCASPSPASSSSSSFFFFPRGSVLRRKGTSARRARSSSGGTRARRSSSRSPSTRARTSRGTRTRRRAS